MAKKKRQRISYGTHATYSVSDVVLKVLQCCLWRVRQEAID
jgi:hypothetical protein